ncbi:PepSY domain-containing protein [Methylocystis echinoides]|uniref:PepSY domain-containing protein n=1 Tax=Methylocystis echinoides TaxID=29468 RepID=UPI003432BED2
MRLLLFVHRWIGVALAVFMLLWFSTGLIIANSGSVALSRATQLAHLPSLDPQAGWLSANEAIARSAESGGPFNVGAIAEARLRRLGDEPAWIVENRLGERLAVSAASGRPVSVGTALAARIAGDWLAAERKVASIAYIDTVDAVTGLRNAETLRPFHRFAVGDGAGTVLVVSAKSGEILQAATRLERGLHYVGGWLHLFRPLDLLNAGDYRRAALAYAGFLAFVGAATGVVVGWLKWKPGLFGRPTYARGRMQPYREAWLKYHFWAGLVGGAFAALWAGSGFLSTNPGEIFSPAGASRDELVRYYGAGPAAPVENWASILDAARDAVELRVSRLGESAVLVAYYRDGARRPLAPAKQGVAEDDIVAAAARLSGATPIAGRAWLQGYDSYYSPAHGQGALDRPLPALRVDLADRGHTSLYVDRADGRLLLKIDDSRRAYRWLYSAVHHWDFGWFDAHPAARRVWISLLALIGLALAASAVTLAWRRVKRSLPAPASEPAKPGAAPVAPLS